MTQPFFSLVDRLNALPSEDHRGIEDLIWHTFGVEKAVLALDMSHFSLSVRRTGILRYLGLIRRMQILTRPIVGECRGEVIKFEADNLMAVFADASDAVTAAVRINQALGAGTLQSGAEAYAVGIGIDHGPFLMIPDEDCYGDAVNVAYKLGEDLARPHEVLITDAARAQLGAEFPYRLVEQQVSISGLEIIAFSVQYPLGS